jgi:hypothetical protein
MYVDADLTASPVAVALREPDDFRSLKVVVQAPQESPDQLAAALSPLGWLDEDGNAFLKIDELKRLAGDRAYDHEWLESFGAMVDYARSKGWVGGDGAALQAHCEWHGGTAG